MAEYLNGIIPLGPMGAAEEVADFVAYLAGVNSSFIHGSVLTMAGGMTA